MSYVYYQLVGGTEEWSPIQANLEAELKALKPTFVTILALDTLLPDKPGRDVLEKVKYTGPMYYDLDSKDGVADSIEDMQELWKKHAALGLEPSDVEIYLSGKKGLHMVIPPAVFMPKPGAVQRLPAVYKELAFTMAVRTLDFAVYTARKGRMLRTCHNIRENGNYRVPITVDELLTLTPEKYSELCKTPRTVPPANPSFKFKFALEFDKAAAKLPKLGVKKTAPSDPTLVRKQWGDVEGVFNGSNVNPDYGFNKIAIQIALYGRDAGWNVDTFIEKAQGLIQNHQSDGDRYNTPTRREDELRRMWDYVDDNPAYDYSLGGVKAAMLVKPDKTVNAETGEEEVVLSSGVNVRGNCYTATKGDDGEQVISNFVLDKPYRVIDITSNTIVGIVCQLRGLGGQEVTLMPTNFTSSSGLQSTLAPYGASFAGSDVHARGVYQVMLKEASENRFLVSSEGVNIVNISFGVPQDLMGKDFVVWADRTGVQVPHSMNDENGNPRVNLVFQGYPETHGVLRTDLATTMGVNEYFDEHDGKRRMAHALQSLFKCHPAETIGKMVGWMNACHWKPIFQKTYGKFPLLHVYGAAGAGKSELTVAMLQMFYNHEPPKHMTPTGTSYSFQSLVAGSSSIPVILDEYKPHKMKEKVEGYRAVFRDAYNAKQVRRGGGSRTKESFNALSTETLSGPIGFIAEAIEGETAIVERSVLIGVRRQPPRVAAEGLRNFMEFTADMSCLPVIGKYMAGWVVDVWNPETLRAEFDAMHTWALQKFMLQPGDHEKLQAKEMTEDVYNRKLLGRPRPIFNATVALFGLVQFRRAMQEFFGEEFKEKFGEAFKEMANTIYDNMDTVARTSLPEYIKVMQTVSDITRMTDRSAYTMVEGIDYNLCRAGETVVFAFHLRSVYNKYRAYMKAVGGDPLYSSDNSFEVALSETPEFFGYGTGTARQKGKVVLLNLEELVRNGVPEFPGKIVPLPQ